AERIAGEIGAEAIAGVDLIIVLPVHRERHADLLQVASTGGTARPGTDLREDGKKDCGQNGNDGYHNEELDQGKGVSLFPANRRTSHRSYGSFRRSAPFPEEACSVAGVSDDRRRIL